MADQPAAEDVPEDSPGSKLDYLHQAFAAVPGIGQGQRWYDVPYKLTTWLSSGWRRRLLPQRALDRLNLMANYLLPFGEHDRNKAWSLEDPMQNLLVPADEHVNLAVMWAVELFPPTEIPRLERAIAKHNWDRRKSFIYGRPGNREHLARSRAGRGWTWWRFAELVRVGSKWWVPDGIKTRLPEAFEMVELRATQVRRGLTAVIAEFHMTDEAATSIDKEWHSPHEPLLVRARGTRPRTYDRQSAGTRQTQLVRRAHHDAARGFLAATLPGFFATNSTPLPMLDLLLFDKYDPTRKSEQGMEWRDSLRALGLREEIYHVQSKELPKLLLSQMHGDGFDHMDGAPAWTLWGKRSAIVRALGEKGLSGYGSDKNRAIAARLVDNMYNVFVMLAVNEYLGVTEASYAKIRDEASRQHGRFRPRSLVTLRKAFLTLSLNTSTVHRDVVVFWNRKWRRVGDAQFTTRLAPKFRAQDRASGRRDEKSTSFNKQLRESQETSFDHLLAADRDYRDILSTVASLGASADTYRMGRLALLVSAASLIVAIAALIVTASLTPG